MNALVGELASIAGLMAVVTALLVKWAAEAPDRMGRGVILFVFVMMTSMAGAAVGYFSDPTTASLVESFGISGGIMLVAAAGLFAVFYREGRAGASREGPAPAPASTQASWAFLATVAALVLLGEFLMGWAFQIAASPGSVPTGGDLTVFASAVLNSPWFLFTMASEMALTTLLLRSQLGRAFVPVLSLQALIMFLSPTALPTADFGTYGATIGGLAIGVDLSWAWVAAVGGSAAMIALFVYQMEYIYQHRELQRSIGRYTVLLVGVYGVMMAGLYVWLTYADARLFALSVVAEMGLYLTAVLSPARFTSEETFPWQLHANWAFALLGGIFVAEIFMGAVLDLVIEPWAYGPATGYFPAYALSGSAGVLASNAFANGFFFLAATTASTWFLAMMGVEMGALVVFKLRESRNRENRIRMGLMLGSYALFATFFSSWYYTYMFPNWESGTQVPFLGWSMGLGSGPVVPSLFLVILMTYVITAVLTFLFGRRVICSVFCTAPLMYQGTTIDAMTTFNRGSRIGRKYLGSRLSSLYMATTGLVMSSLVAVSFLSYYNNNSLTNVTYYGTDPAIVAFDLYFGVLWYLMFVAIPYVGNYNCVTMGWCYTGTIAAVFQKLGPYKLKVRDPKVCKACTTLDCAKACPVGLVDMPGHFRTKGEFRSSKCCGIGKCVGVCPYGNLYIYDIRHWVQERWGHPQVPPDGQRLPMLRPNVRGTLSSAGPAPRAPGPSHDPPVS